MASARLPSLHALSLRTAPTAMPAERPVKSEIQKLMAILDDECFATCLDPEKLKDERVLPETVRWMKELLVKEYENAHGSMQEDPGFSRKRAREAEDAAAAAAASRQSSSDDDDDPIPDGWVSLTEMLEDSEIRNAFKAVQSYWVDNDFGDREDTDAQLQNVLEPMAMEGLLGAARWFHGLNDEDEDEEEIERIKNELVEMLGVTRHYHTQAEQDE